MTHRVFRVFPSRLSPSSTFTPPEAAGRAADHAISPGTGRGGASIPWKRSRTAERRSFRSDSDKPRQAAAPTRPARSPSTSSDSRNEPRGPLIADIAARRAASEASSSSRGVGWASSDSATARISGAIRSNRFIGSLNHRFLSPGSFLRQMDRWPMDRFRWNLLFRVSTR